MDSQKSFSSKVRNVIWPIYGQESKLFTPMALMMACILFAYTMCRGIKDTGVVNAANGSAIITFLKVYAVVPFAILFFILFSWLSNKFNRRTVFYVVIVPFLVYFAAYAFLIYPNEKLLEPTAFVDGMVAWFPEGPMRNWFEIFFAMIKYWTHASFYVMSELWGSAVLSLLFWQFANDIIPVANAKRFYAHFYLVGNVAVMLAGFLTETISGSYKKDYLTGMQIMVSLIIVAGALAVALYYYVNNYVLTNPAFQLTEGSKPAKKEKAKMSIVEGVKFLFSSRYLGLIALLVICYGISINLVEVLWKEIILENYRNVYMDVADLGERASLVKASYNAYMGSYFFYTGMFTIVAILIGSAVLRKFGWRKTAMATPILLGLSAGIFYLCVIFKSPIGASFGMSTASIISVSVWVGLIQNLLSKPTKYAMFDPTKEMAYIPLDNESKMKGKAAVDVVGARLGKSGGAMLGQVLSAFKGAVVNYADWSFGITIVIVGIWIAAVSALSKRFSALTGEK